MKFNNKNKNNIFNLMKNVFTVLVLSLTILMTLPESEAYIKLDNVYIDPAIVAAGDEVDVIIQYTTESLSEDSSKVGDEDYSLEVSLSADDSLTKEYIIIQDADGDLTHGSTLAGRTYSKKFRIKVNNNAPAGTYEFKLDAIWYYKGAASTSIQSSRFNIDVKKEGIILDVATIQTTPAQVRPGDNFVKLTGFIENVGEKDAKSVDVRLYAPEGITSSYSNDNRVWAGRVNAGERKEVTFFVDIDENLPAGAHNINFEFDYMDLDDNSYSKSREIPFLVKSRPYLEVVKYEGSMKAGETGQLFVNVKNTGEESAEAVDVRILKQNAQPFDIDVRSDYIGELIPGEEGLAIFDISAKNDAEIKTHDFKILIRSKGDSDEGDDNIYTYNRRAKVEITGKASNKLFAFGAIGLSVLLSIFAAKKVVTKTRGKK